MPLLDVLYRALVWWNTMMIRWNLQWHVLYNVLFGYTADIWAQT